MMQEKQPDPLIRWVFDVDIKNEPSACMSLHLANGHRMSFVSINFACLNWTNPEKDLTTWIAALNYIFLHEMTHWAAEEHEQQVPYSHNSLRDKILGDLSGVHLLF